MSYSYDINWYMDKLYKINKKLGDKEYMKQLNS